MARLTDTTIRNLRFDGKVKKVFDDALPQFGVRVYQSGVSFIVMYGDDRRMKTLGKYPDISLKDARKLALPYLGRKTRENVSVSYSEAVETYLEAVRPQLRAKTYTQYDTYLRRAPVSGPLATITRQSFGDYLTAPNKAITLKVFFNWCMANDLIDRNPVAHVPVRYGAPRTRVLDDDELKAVWSKLTEDTFSAIVRLLILTGQRRSEVQHFKLDGDLVTIPAAHTKNKREHVFPVGTVTVPYLVPVQGQLQFQGWSKAKRRLDKLSGVTDWTIHDLRRTFATKHAELGTPIHVVERILNHVSGSLAGVAGIYNRHSYMNEMREASQRYENWVQSHLLRHVKT